MSAHRKSRKFVPLAAVVLCLMAAAAFGGYVAASNRTPGNGRVADTLNLAGAQKSASPGMTVYACLASGKLTSVSAGAAPKCPAKSVPVQWSAQLGRASSPRRPSSPAPSSSPPRSSPPSTPPSSPQDPAPSAAPTPSSPSGLGAPCVTSAGRGSCGPYSYAGITGGNQTSVIQDVWNPIDGASQTLTAYNPGNWSASASMPAGNTAVVSYPDTQQIYTTNANAPDPLSSFSSITSSFTGSDPDGAGSDYEAAYDIWAGTGTSDYAQEIMIWTDNHGQRPAGSQLQTVTIAGVSYQVWSTGKAGSTGNPVTLVTGSNETSGTVNVLADLDWLEANGYMPAGSGLNQIDYGWEICSTGGVPETFTLSQYGIKVACSSGSSCTQ
jgi:hypothetical protein